MEIPGFKLLDQIGEGPMAVVWKAHQLSLDRVVAIKVLKPKFAAKPGEVHPLLQEARMAAKLKHPNVIPIFDTGDLQGTLYFVMEFINGASVSQWLKKHKEGMRPKTAVPVIRAVVDVLQHAYATANLTHRGINPDNILIDADGAVKLADLGLVKATDPAYFSSQLSSGTLTGRLNYLSPEQAKCSIRIDFRTDMYGLGATLYHMVTGVMPFADQDPKEVINQHLTGFLTNPHDLNQSVTPGLAQVIARLMMKDYRQRYESWSAVLEDMKKMSSARIVVSKANMPVLEGEEPVSTVAPAKVVHKAMRSFRLERSGSAEARGKEPGEIPAWAHMAIGTAILAWWLWAGWFQLRLPPLVTLRLPPPPPVTRPNIALAPARTSGPVAAKPVAAVPALPPPPTVAPREEGPMDLDALKGVRRLVANAVCGQDFDRALLLVQRELEYEHSREYEGEVKQMRNLLASAVDMRKKVEAALTEKAGTEVTVSDRGVQRRITVRSAANGNILGDIYEKVGSARIGKPVTVPVSKLDPSELDRMGGGRSAGPGRDLWLGVLHLQKGDYATAKPYLERCAPLAAELEEVGKAKQENVRGTDGSQGS